MAAASAPAPRRSDRLGLVESSSGDLPYYDGQPVRLSAPQWLFVLVALAFGSPC